MNHLCYSTDVRQNPKEAYRYKAFISYSHDPDAELAQLLEKCLERFAKPWYKRRSIDVFRDNSDLHANPALWDSICEALDNSEYFILLASPQSAQSHWVGLEVQRFLDGRTEEGTDRRLREGLHKILIVCTAWSLLWAQLPLPEILRKEVNSEPRSVDLRWSKEASPLDDKDPRFYDAAADLAAPLYGKRKSDLIGEDVKQHRKTKRIALLTAAIMLGLCIATTISAGVAIKNRRLAELEQTRAEARSLAHLSEESDLSPTFRLQLASESLREDHDSVEAKEAVSKAAFGTRFLRDRLRGNSSFAYMVTYDPSGKYVISSNADGTICIWKNHNKKLLFNRPIFDCPATCICVSPDSRLIAIGGQNGSIVLFSLESQRRIKQLDNVHSGSVLGVTFERTGHWLASVGMDNKINQWRVGSLVSDSDSTTPVVHLLPEDVKAYSVAYSPTSDELAVGCSDGNLRLWPTFDSTSATRVSTGSEWIYALAFSHDGAYIATGSGDHNIKIWDVDTQKQFGDDMNCGVSVTALAFSLDDTEIYSAGDSSIKRWRVADSKSAWPSFSCDSDAVDSVAVNPHAAGEIVSSSWDGCILQWDANSQDGFSVEIGKFQSSPVTGFLRKNDLITVDSSGRISGWPLRGGTLKETILKPGQGAVGYETFSIDPTKTLVAAGQGDGRLVIWNILSHRIVLSTRPDGKRIWQVAFSHSGNLLATANDAGSVNVYRFTPTQTNLLGRRIKLGYKGEGVAVQAIAFTDNDSQLIVGNANDDIVVCTLGTNSAAIRLPRLHKNSIDCILALPGSDKFLASDGDGRVAEWSVKSKTMHFLPIASQDEIDSMDFDLHTHRLYWGDGEGKVFECDERTGLVKDYVDHDTEQIYTLSKCPDNDYLVTGNIHGEIILWDTKTRKIVSTERAAHYSYVNNLKFIDGRHFMSCGEDARIVLWEIVRKGKTATMVREGTVSSWYAPITSASYCRETDTLALGTKAGNVQFWNMERGRATYRPVHVAKKSISCLCWCSGGLAFVAGSEDHCAYYCELGKQPILLGKTGGTVTVAVTEHRGKAAFFGGADLTIRSANTADHLPKLSLVGKHFNDIASLAVSPDDTLLASGGRDRRVVFWRIRDGKCLAEQVAHTGSVSSMAFSPNGEQFLSAGSDGSIRLWNVDTLRPYSLRLNAQDDRIINVEYANDEAFVTLSKDRTGFLWNADYEEWLKWARVHLGWNSR